MDRSVREEMVMELNLIKKLMRELEKEGEVTERERNTIMKHVGAIKAVLRDDVIPCAPGMTKHVMRQSRM